MKVLELHLFSIFTTGAKVKKQTNVFAMAEVGTKGVTIGCAARAAALGTTAHRGLGPFYISLSDTISLTHSLTHSLYRSLKHEAQ